MYVDTIHLKDERALLSVANEIFPLFGIKNFEKMENSFYPKGQYYRGRGELFDLRITVEDDIGYENYDFCLVFGFIEKAHRNQDDVLRVLLSNNYDVCRARGDDRNPAREVYSLGADKQIIAKIEQLKR